MALSYSNVKLPGIEWDIISFSDESKFLPAAKTWWIA
jgi:hypothetical protein